MRQRQYSTTHQLACQLCVVILIVLQVNLSPAELLNDTYIAAPSKLYMGLENMVSVRTAFPNTRVKVTTSKYGLTDTIDDPITYRTQSTPSGWYEVKIPYRLPFVFTDSANTIVTLNFTLTHCVTESCDQFTTQYLAQSYTVHTLPIHLVGETDKPLYRPDETVRFRFMVLTPQLLWPQSGPVIFPSLKLIRNTPDRKLSLVPVTSDDEEFTDHLKAPILEEITVQDPSQTVVKRWTSVDPEQAFLLNYTLLSDAPTGEWKVSASLRGLNQVTEELLFTVKQYVLPPFTISMQQPESLSFESKYAQFGVCARYTNGPPMTGSVRAHLCVCSKSSSQSPAEQSAMLEDQACAALPWRSERRPCAPISAVLSSKDGCARFNVSTQLLNLNNPTYPTWDQVPVICAHVEEEGTGSNVTRCEAGSKSIQYTEARFELHAPRVFKPDLPIVGSLRLIHPDLPSLQNVTVRLMAEEVQQRCFIGLYRDRWANEFDGYRFTQLLTTDANGFARFSIPPINANHTVHLEVSYRTHIEPNSTKPAQRMKRMIMPRPRPPKTQDVSARQEMYPWLSHHKKFMIVWPTSDAVQITCPGHVQFQLLANVPLNDKMIHVDSVVRGKHLSQVILPKPNLAPDPCVDRDDDLGHYQCVNPSESDDIICRPGWKGDNCLIPTCTQYCHPKGGICSGPETCTCFPYWSGSQCDICTDENQCGRSKVQVEQIEKDEEVEQSTMEPTREETVEQTEPVRVSESSEVQAAPRRTLHVRSISIPVDGNWGPETTLVVYIMHKELATSGIIPVTIKLSGMSNCISPATAMEAQLSKSGMSLSHSHVTPGQAIQLTLNPPGLTLPESSKEANNQYCFVRMQDESLDNFDGKQSRIDRDELVKVISNEHKYDQYSAPTSEDQAFRAAGLRLMSNTPVEMIRPVPCPYVAYSANVVFDGHPRGMPGPAYAETDIEPETLDDMVPAKIATKPRLRDFFPEVWLFDYYPIQWTKSNGRHIGQIERNLTVPDTITRWKANVFCTTHSNGLWVPKSRELITNMPFFVDITLPLKVRRGEILHLPLSVFASRSEDSGLEECMSFSVHAQLNSSDWSTIGARSFMDCLCPGEKKTFQLGLIAKRLGLLNVTVEAQARTKSIMCATADADDADQIPNDPATAQTFSDMIRRGIRVEAEGIRTDVVLGDILCFSDDNRSPKVEFPVSLSHLTDYVNDSLRVYMSYSDEVLGPALANPDKLVRLPVGCGEQNMVLVAPNVYVLDYFTSTSSNGTNRMIEKMKRDTKMHILTGYHRQLKYRHDDGSYSAFGKSDKQGSTWLTAFVLRVFAKAYKVDKELAIDWSTLFTDTINFIQTSQDNVTGCFKEFGRVLHSGMQGAIGEGVEGEQELLLTAYILSAILETRPSNQSDWSFELSHVIENGKRCLYDKHRMNQNTMVKQLSTYALAQVAYTLTLLEPKSNQARPLQQELLARQHRSTPEGLSQALHYWSARQDTKQDQNKFTALDVETTSYALLTLSLIGTEQQDLFPAVRWLSSLQKIEGGFFSTQDTVLALEVIAKFAKTLDLANENSENNPILVRATVSPANALLQDTITADKQHMSNQVAITDKVKRPEDIEKITWILTSAKPRGGCLAVHSSLIYHVLERESEKQAGFDLITLVEQPKQPPANACTTATLSICVQPNEARPINTGMLLVKVAMISGWTPVREQILKQVSGASETPRQVEFAPDDSVSIYFDGFTGTNSGNLEDKRCAKLHMYQIVRVEQAKPAQIEAMDYYETTRQVSKSYTLDGCSSAWDAQSNEVPSPVTDLPKPGTEAVTETSVSHCPNCELSGKMNETLISNMLKYVCTGWSNLLMVRVLEIKNGHPEITISSLGYGSSVSSWNATVINAEDLTCSCSSMIAGANLLWISPNSGLIMQPGDPEVSLVTNDPDALLIPFHAVWPAIQIARDQWKSGEYEKYTKVYGTPFRCARIDLLWRFVKSRFN